MEDELIPGPMLPPRADAPSVLDRAAQERATIDPTSNRAAEIQQQEDEQGFLENLVTGFQDTALAAGIRLAKDEGTRLAADMGAGPDQNPITNGLLTIAGTAKALMGARHGKADYDKSKEYEALTAGIPYEYHDNIMSHDNLAGAKRSRARVEADLKRGRVMANQRGASSTFALLAGSVADVDLPLTLMTGGGFKAATVAGKSLRLAAKAGVSPRVATRFASGAVTASGGLQAGLLVGMAEANWSEVEDWTTVGEVALQSMILGGVIGTTLNADKLTAVKAAQKELHERIATNNPNLRDPVDVDLHEASPIIRDEPFIMDAEGNIMPVPEHKEGGVGARKEYAVDRTSINAASNPASTATLFQTTTINDPAGAVSRTTQEIHRNAEKWVQDSGWRDRKTDAEDEWWTKVALSGPFNLTSRNFRSLYTSNAPELNWIAGNVFESPHGLGRGRATSSAYNEMYQRKIFNHISANVPNLMNDWAKRNNYTWAKSGYLINQEGIEVFNREVMLELNDRRLGRAGHHRDVSILTAADAYEKAGLEAYNIGKGRPGQIAVDGFEDGTGVKYERGYSPYVHNGAEMLRLIKEGIVKRDDLAKTYANAYVHAGKIQMQDAEKIAEAVIQRAIARDIDVDMSLAGLLSGDGREFLRTALHGANVPRKEVDAIMARLTGDAAEKGKQSFAKGRNELDLSMRIPTQNGQDIRLVDMLNKDMHGVWQRYTRRMSGAAAMARVGLSNKQKVEDLITAARATQRSLGEEPMDADLLRAMFSNFEGGAVNGYSFGVRNEGIGLELAFAKRMANLSLLNKLGIAQLAETAATIAQSGFQNWWTRGVMAKFDQQIKADSEGLRADLAFITGDLGQDHLHFAPHLDLDDVSGKDRAEWLKTVSKLASNAQAVQGYTSVFNQTRKWQQQTAALAMTDKVLRTLKDAITKGGGEWRLDMDPKLVRRLQDDLGLMPEDLDMLTALIENGTIEFKTAGKHEYVNRLNMDKWDADFADVFGAAITRNMNQVVQKAMAGETDAFMQSGMWSILLHLKTFPLVAMQKQFIRNMRHMDYQTLNMLLYGMATAGVATAVKDAIEGKERTTMERAKIAFSYSNITGWAPMFYDPLMAGVGLEDYRVNAYGPNSDLTPPTVTWANRALNLPGAAVSKLTGNADYYDNWSLKALPFANAYGMSRVLD